jgi:hypothetical protein
MGHAIGTVTGSLGDEAHYKVLAAIKTLAEANGWTTLRYVSTGANRELILTSTGLSGTEQLFVGFKTTQSVASDYYNLVVGTMAGYVPGNTFESQPGIKLSGVPCHNNAVTYFLSANAQRITGCFKVGTPVYGHFYVGRFFPYARPAEYPASWITAGNFRSDQLYKRYSDTDYCFPYYGSFANVYGSGLGVDYAQFWLRSQSGSWIQVFMFPYRNGPVNNRPSQESNYALESIIPYQTNPQGAFGELDGIYFVSGFNNSGESVLQKGGTPVDQSGMDAPTAVAAIIAAGGVPYVILQDTNRTGFNSYIAMEMS